MHLSPQGEYLDDSRMICSASDLRTKRVEVGHKVKSSEFYQRGGCPREFSRKIADTPFAPGWGYLY